MRHTALASARGTATLAVMPVRTRRTRAGNVGRPRWPARRKVRRAGAGNIHGYAELDPSTHNGAEVRRTVAWDLDVWGTVTQERGALRVGGAWDMRLRHAGKWHEIHGQLIDYGFRFYHPGLGRFINRDPLGPAGGLNPYAFLGNNPANLVEFRGLSPIKSQGKKGFKITTSYHVVDVDLAASRTQRTGQSREYAAVSVAYDNAGAPGGGGREQEGCTDGGRCRGWAWGGA